MNDLDRRIAEAKGFKFGLDGAVAAGPDGKHYLSAWFCWSTSDAKAFELVDELAPATDKKDPEWGFMCGIFGKEWNATFYKAVHRNGDLVCDPIRLEGNAPTRPEAICRAYLAAMEWMKARKG